MSTTRQRDVRRTGLWVSALALAALLSTPLATAQVATSRDGAVAAPGQDSPGTPTPAPTREGAPAPSSRLLTDVPLATPPPAPQDAMAPTPTGSAADDAAVSRELGTTPPEPPPSAEAPLPAIPPELGKEDWLSGKRELPLRGVMSVGVGSHDSYQVGVGVSTTLGPNTTISAGVATGRWDGRWDGPWGWWPYDPISPYQTFPELNP